MLLNRRLRSGNGQPVEELRPSSRTKKLGILVALIAFLSVVPLPGMEFAPVASATERSFSSLRLDPNPDANSLGSGRVIRGEESTEPFTLIGLTYESEPTEPVLVRVHQGGAWGEWKELPLEGSSGPDENSKEAARVEAADAPKFSSEPSFVGSADGYQVSIATDSQSGTQVSLVRESIGRVITDATPVADAATPLIATMRTRAEWGARAPKNTPRYATTVQMGVVHHSDSGNSYSPAQVPAALRSIQAFHMDSNGWDDIGYNFVVDKYGGIWEGRGGGADKAVIGAHAEGFNSGTVGVMVLGTYTSLAPTAASVESVAHVIGWKMATFGVNPTGRVDFTSGGSKRYPAGQVINLARVVGHGDVGLTSCPGQIRNSLSAIQARAIDYYNWYYKLMTSEGAVESVTGGVGTVTFTGWANDPMASGAAWIRASAGSVSSSFYTGISRPDIQAAKGFGPNTGWSGTLTGVEPGMQSACALIQNTSGGTTSLGCKWVLVTDPTGKSPVGRFDYAVATPGEVHIQGWALDPESVSTVKYDVLIDGQVRWTAHADQTSDSIPQSYVDSGLGRMHQFKARVPAIVGGPHNVCVKVYNYKGGVDTLVDCKVLNVPSHVPGGAVEIVGSSLKNRLDLTGWALDLETASPINIRVVVGGRSYVVPADRPRSDIAALYPGYGSQHGFATTVYADGGNQTYCVYGVNVGGGSDGLLGCGTINIVK